MFSEFKKTRQFARRFAPWQTTSTYSADPFPTAQRLRRNPIMTGACGAMDHNRTAPSARPRGSQSACGAPDHTTSKKRLRRCSNADFLQQYHEFRFPTSCDFKNGCDRRSAPYIAALEHPECFQPKFQKHAPERYYISI